MRKYREDRLAAVKPHCEAAIRTMRQFIDDAERIINREGTTPEEMIEGVMGKLAWGWANASSSLASAVSALQDARKIAEASLPEVEG